MPSGTMETFEVKTEDMDHTIFNGKKCPRTAVENVSPYTLAEDYQNIPSASNSVKQEDEEECHLSRNIETIFLPNIHEGVAVESPFFDYDYYKEVCRKRTECCETSNLPVFYSDLSTENGFKTTSEINNQCIYYIQQPQYPVTISNTEQEIEHKYDSRLNNTHVNFNFFQQLPRDSDVLENNNNLLYNSAERRKNINSVVNNKFITVKPDMALKEVNNKTKMYTTRKTDSTQIGRLYQKRANRSSNNETFLCKTRKAPEKFIKSNIPLKDIIDVNTNKTAVTYKSAYTSKSNIQSDPLYQQKMIVSSENTKFLKIAKKRAYNRIINKQPDVPIKEVIEVNRNKTHVRYKMGQDNNILMSPVCQKKNGKVNFFGKTAKTPEKYENKDVYIIENNDEKEKMPSVPINSENREISIKNTGSRGSTTTRNGHFENVSGYAEKRSKLVWHEENRIQLNPIENEEKFKCPLCKRPREFLTLVAVNNHLKFNHISILPKIRLEAGKK